jgi:hypothetical protein
MRNFKPLAAGIWAGVIVLGLCGSARAGDAGRARRDLMFALDNAQTQRWDDFISNMQKAEVDMEGLGDAEKAPLQQQMAQIKDVVTQSIQEDVNRRLDKAAQAGAGEDKLDIDRTTMRLNSDEAKFADKAALDKLKARLGSVSGGGSPSPAPKPDTPAPTVTPKGPMSEDISTAVSRMRTAHAMFEQGEPRIAEKMMREAIKLVESAPAAGKNAILSDAAALSKQIDAADLKAEHDEEARRVDEQVHRYIFTADSSIEPGTVCDPEWIDKSEALLASHDVQTYMEPAKIKEYQTQLDGIRQKLRTHNIQVSLERSAANLKDLEDEVAADPFKGADEASAHRTYVDLKTLSQRVRKEFDGVPKEEPQVSAVLDRVAAADSKIESAAGKWAVQQVEEQFASSWKFNSQDFAGWEQENLDPAAAANRQVAGLEKTARAIRGTIYWFNDADTKQTVSRYGTDASIAATVQAAQKLLDNASAKLNSAFNAVLEQAEHKPMPGRETDRAQVLYLVSDGARWFDGTKYKDANVARASALDAKWKAQVAQMEKEMEETLKQLTAEANAAWPAIEASVAPQKGFDPADPGSWKGKTIEIKGRYNRSGWDFDGAYSWAADVKGIPVAGDYDEHVAQAFAAGEHHTKFGIDDHVGWDVIAIVQGPGTIRRKTITEWRDKETHEPIMKTESYVSEPCVVIKIIGLRAGPVAVGPK